MLEHLIQVRFSPLMTLPTTVKITAQDFETKLAWSALPGSIISVPAGQAMNHLFFPKRRFVAGFFRRLLAYIISCKSISIIPHYCCNTHPFNTYRFNTYPFNMHPVHAYPFNTYPFNTYASAGMAMNVNGRPCKTYPCIVCISWNGIVLPLLPQGKVYFHHEFFNLISTISLDQKHFEP